MLDVAQRLDALRSDERRKALGVACGHCAVLQEIVKLPKARLLLCRLHASYTAATASVAQ